MTDKRFGPWSPERREAHSERMSKRRKPGTIPGPAARLRELAAMVEEISGRMALADSADRTGWAAELRAAVRKASGIPEVEPFQHDADCRLAATMRGTVLVECEHGYDVCPKCDPCLCWAPT